MKSGAPHTKQQSSGGPPEMWWKRSETLVIGGGEGTSQSCGPWLQGDNS